MQTVIVSATKRLGATGSASSINWQIRSEHRARVVGVDRRDPAGMTGVPGLDELEGSNAASDLADDDSIRSGAERVHDRAVPTVDGLLDPELQLVRGRALKLAQILDDVEAVFVAVAISSRMAFVSVVFRASRAADEDVGAARGRRRESESAWPREMMPRAT